jgi:ABC-type cobalamin/Fe3+-siderophores transport system ATPase subunit
MTASALLEAEDLFVARGGAPILRGVSVTLRAGEAVALVGPNAAGKSTLVRTLAGLLPVTSGIVRLEGKPLDQWGRSALARAVALVTPEEGAPVLLSVQERVALGRYPHRGPFRPLTPADRDAVSLALQRTGIAHLAHRPLSTLSSGERQLAALARSLAQQPRVLLLDEPAAHLDIGHQLQLFRVLDEIRAASGVAVLAVVHDLQRAAAWAERMLLLDGGRLAASGAPADVLASKECARAFHVEIRGHAAAGLSHSVYSFEESR